MTHESLHAELTGIVGESNVISERESLLAYRRDPSPFIAPLPGIVVKPTTIDQVCQVIELANRAGVPVVPRGNGYSFSGLSIKRDSSIVLDLTPLDRMIALDQDNMTVTAECGMIVGHLSDVVMGNGYNIHTVAVPYYKTTLGGMLSGVIGGGFPLDAPIVGLNGRNVIGIKVVLPSGRLMEVGGGQGTNINRLKASLREADGPDALGLFIGDAGIFGVKVEATLAIFPSPKSSLSGCFRFPRFEGVWTAVSEVMIEEPIPYSQALVCDPILTSQIANEAVDSWAFFYCIQGHHQAELEERRISLREACARNGGADGAGRLAEYAQALCTGKAFREVTYAQTIHADTIQKASPATQRTVGRGAMPFFTSRSTFSDHFLKVQTFVDDLCRERRLSRYQVTRGDRFMPVTHNSVWAVVNMYYDYSDERARSEVLNILNDTYNYAAHLGVMFESHGGHAADIQGANWSQSYRDFIRSVKKALDPNNILNPGVWAI